MSFFEHRLAEQFIDHFTSATKLQIAERKDNLRFTDTAGSRREVDLSLRIDSPEGRQFVLAVDIKRSVYPRDIRAIHEPLMAYGQRLATDGEQAPVLPLIAAEHLSEGVRQTLRKAGINYFDATGTLHFEHGTRLVDIERAPASPPDRRIGSIFSGAREHVVHAVLHHWHHSGGTATIAGNELATLARTSVYTVSKTLQEMERQDWILTEGSGPGQRRRLKRPAALLDAWADAWTQRSEQRTRWYIYAPAGVQNVLAESLSASAGWAVTGAAAANLLAPHLSRVDRVTVMVEPGAVEEWARRLRLERAEQGANVVMMERTGAAWLFADESPNVMGLRLASPFVQYLDLLDGAGRNKELAAELRQRYLKIEGSPGE